MIKCLKLTRWQSVLLVLVLFPVHVPAVDEESFDILDIDDSPRIRDVQYPGWFKLSFLDLQEDLDEAVANLKQGIIVYFSQKDCGYCEIMAKVNFGREKDIVQYTRKHFDVVPLDIWGSREVNGMEGHSLEERDYAVREKTNFTPTVGWCLVSN
jgi:thioredoxin-related protein